MRGVELSVRRREGLERVAVLRQLQELDALPAGPAHEAQAPPIQWRLGVAWQVEQVRGVQANVRPAYSHARTHAPT
jgi:hypothetical protein